MAEATSKKPGSSTRPGVAVATKARVRRKSERNGTDSIANGTVLQSAAKQPASKTSKRTRARTSDQMKSSMLHIRLEDSLKADVTKTLDKIGISMPEAIRVFLKRIVREQAFPFHLEVPNAETAAALRESLATTDRRRHLSTEGMFDDLENGGVR